MNDAIQYKRNINATLSRIRWLDYENSLIQKDYIQINQKLIYNLLVLLLRKNHRMENSNVNIGYFLYVGILTDLLGLTYREKRKHHTIQYFTSIGKQFINRFISDYQMSIRESRGEYYNKEMLYKSYSNRIMKASIFKKPLLISKVFALSKKSKHIDFNLKYNQWMNVSHLNDKIHELYKKNHEKESILSTSSIIFPFYVDKALNRRGTLTDSMINILIKRSQRDAKKLYYGSGALNKISFLKFLAKNKVWQKLGNNINGYIRFTIIKRNLFVSR